MVDLIFVQVSAGHNSAVLVAIAIKETPCLRSDRRQVATIKSYSVRMNFEFDDLLDRCNAIICINKQVPSRKYLDKPFEGFLFFLKPHYKRMSHCTMYWYPKLVASKHIRGPLAPPDVRSSCSQNSRLWSMSTP